MEKLIKFKNTPLEAKYGWIDERNFFINEKGEVYKKTDKGLKYLKILRKNPDKFDRRYTGDLQIHRLIDGKKSSVTLPVLTLIKCMFFKEYDKNLILIANDNDYSNMSLSNFHLGTLSEYRLIQSDGLSISKVKFSLRELVELVTTLRNAKSGLFTIEDLVYIVKKRYYDEDMSQMYALFRTSDRERYSGLKYYLINNKIIKDEEAYYGLHSKIKQQSSIDHQANISKIHKRQMIHIVDIIGNSENPNLIKMFGIDQRLYNRVKKAIKNKDLYIEIAGKKYSLSKFHKQISA